MSQVKNAGREKEVILKSENLNLDDERGRNDHHDLNDL